MSKELSGVFDHKVVATVKDRTYPSAFRNAIYKALVGSDGVSNQIGNKLSLSDISDGVDLKVRLLDGVAFVAGASYRLYDDGTGNSKDLAIDSEQVGLNRIDLVVLEFSSLDVDRVVIAKILKGLPGVSPVVPSLIQSNVEDVKGIYQIALHQVTITGANQNAVVITDIRPFYNDLRSTFLNIAGIIAGTIVVGEADLAAFADEAAADENGRNIATNLSQNAFKNLSDIGLTSGDFIGDEDTDYALINASMPKGSTLILASTVVGLLPLPPAAPTGTLTIVRNNAFNTSLFIEYRNTSATIELHIAFLAGNIFNGWKTLLDTVGKAADSDKLDNLDSTSYTKRETKLKAEGTIIPQGWRKIVKFTTSNGRGSWLVTIKNGGGNQPAQNLVAIISCGTDTGATTGLVDSISILGGNSNDNFNALRLTWNGAESTKYLELDINPINIDRLTISCQPLTDEIKDIRTSYELSDPFTEPGDPTTIINADINNGEVEFSNLLANWNEKFLIGKDGNSASGILLEDFGTAGLTVTSSQVLASATLISGTIPNKYTHLKLEIGTFNESTIIIEIPLDHISVSRSFEFEREGDNANAIDKAEAILFIDGSRNLKGYWALLIAWSGNAASNASIITVTGLRIYKVWGVVR